MIGSYYLVTLTSPFSLKVKAQGHRIKNKNIALQQNADFRVIPFTSVVNTIDDECIINRLRRSHSVDNTGRQCPLVYHADVCITV